MQRKTFIIAILTLLAIFLISTILMQRYQINDPEQIYRVVSVIDGDTFVIGTGESVRLICVDAPEYGEAGYDEASQYLSELIMDKDVTFERDVSDRDYYGRLLRYVYFDGIFVNKEVVNSGHAEVFPYEPDTERCDEIYRAMPGNYEFDVVNKYQSYHNYTKDRDYVTIKNQSEFEDVWRIVYSGTRPQPEAPLIDFNEYQVISVFLGILSSGGSSIGVDKIIEKEESLEVYVKDISPGEGCIVTLAFTSPYQIIKIKKTNKEIIFVTNSQVVDCDY